jgi:hypothetical protein
MKIKYSLHLRNFPSQPSVNICARKLYTLYQGTEGVYISQVLPKQAIRWKHHTKEGYCYWSNLWFMFCCLSWSVKTLAYVWDIQNPNGRHWDHNLLISHAYQSIFILFVPVQCSGCCLNHVHAPQSLYIFVLLHDFSYQYGMINQHLIHTG